MYLYVHVYHPGYNPNLSIHHVHTMLKSQLTLQSRVHGLISLFQL